MEGLKKKPPGNHELQQYLLAKHSSPEDADPLTFGLNNRRTNKLCQK